MNDYLDQTKWEWAHQRRVSPWPLVRLVLVVFCLGVGIGVALSFAFSALSSREVTAAGGGAPRPAAGLTPALGGSAVRASGFPTAARETWARQGRTSGDRVIASMSSPEPLARTTSSESTSAVIEPPAHTTDTIDHSVQSIEQIITNAAIEFGVSPSYLRRVAFCESSLNPSAVGDAGASVGLFQIQRAFWSEVAPRLGYTTDLRHDPIASSRVAAYAFANGRSQAWTCR